MTTAPHNIAVIKKYKTFKFSFPKEKAKNSIMYTNALERTPCPRPKLRRKKYSNYQVTVLTPSLVLSHALLIKANA